MTSGTVKSTSGRGFSFEDYVGAHFALAMLVGERILGYEAGTIVRLDFQVAADGWELDDVLLRLDRGGWCSLSVKSFAQIGKRAPADLINSCWRQLRKRGQGPFVEDRDLLGLVSSPMSAGNYSNLHELLRLAREQDAVDLDRRIQDGTYASVVRRDLWDSFRDPDAEPSSGSPSRLLKVFRHFQFDYDSSPSRDQAWALQWCRDLTLTERSSGALYTFLLQRVNRVRTSGGRIVRDELLKELNSNFDMRHGRDSARFTHYLQSMARSDARLLHSWLALGIDERLAERFQLDESLGAPPATLPDTGVVVLEGALGSGKSLMAERTHRQDLVASLADTDTALPLYMRARDIAAGIPNAIRDLRDHSPGLLAPTGEVRLIVDGLDEVGFTQASNLLSDAREYASAHPTSRVVLTCRQGLKLDDKERLVVPLLDDEEIGSLALAVSGRRWALHGLPKPILEAVRRPLFAIGALVLREEGRAVPRSEAEFIDALVRRSLRQDEVSILAASSALEVAAGHALSNNEAAIRPSLLGSLELEARLLETRLVVRDGPHLRFALPVFEQYFGAHALLNGRLPDALETVRGRTFDRWRYSYVIAAGIGDWDRVCPLLEKLGESSPGAAVWVIKRAVPTNFQARPLSDDFDVDQAAFRLRRSLANWVRWIGEARAFGGLTYEDGQPATVEADATNGRLAVALSRATPETPTRTLAGDDWLHGVWNDHRLGPARWGVPPPESAVWPWAWTMGWVADAIKSFMQTLGERLDTPGLRKEWDSHVLRTLSRWGSSPRQQRSAIELVESTLASMADHEADSIGFGSDNLMLSRVQLDDLRVRIERGEVDLSPPWPPPDLTEDGGSWVWSRYSGAQLASRVGAIYRAALEGYEEVLERFLPSWRPSLGWGSILPIRLEILLDLGSGDGWDGQPWMAVWELPERERDRSQVVVEVVTAEQVRESWSQSDRHASITEAIRQLHPDTAHWASVRTSLTALDVFGAMPATALVWKWIWRDFKDLGLFDSDRPSEWWLR